MKIEFLGLANSAAVKASRPFKPSSFALLDRTQIANPGISSIDSQLILIQFPEWIIHSWEPLLNAPHLLLPRGT